MVFPVIIVGAIVLLIIFTMLGLGANVVNFAFNVPSFIWFGIIGVLAFLIFTGGKKR